VLKRREWSDWWATSLAERSRIRSLIEALVADTYGLDSGVKSEKTLCSREKGDFSWILNPDVTRLKGFWRVDDGKPERARVTTLSLLAYVALRKEGVTGLCRGPAADGWKLPPEARRDLEALDSTEKPKHLSWEDCEKTSKTVRGLWRKLGTPPGPSGGKTKVGSGGQYGLFKREGD